MHKIELHPFSLCAGAGVALLSVVAMAQQVVPIGQVPPRGEQVDQLRRQPMVTVHPSDYVQILEGTPYIVPAGKLLSFTALGGNVEPPSPEWAQLLVDGVPFAGAYMNVLSGASGNGSTMKRLPPGLTADAGSVVTISTTGIPGVNDGSAWGHLVDE